VNPARIDIEIDEIVLHGLAESDVEGFGESLRHELTGLILARYGMLGPDRDNRDGGFGAHVAAAIWPGIAEAVAPAEPVAEPRELP
jgi:hypothetical protein